MFKKAVYICLLTIVAIVVYLYAANFDTKDVIVAVVDTGIDKNNLQNSNQILTGFDFVEIDEDPEDLNGHGTQMSSIIQEIAPKSYILPVKFLQEKKEYSMKRPLAIFYAIIKGADIVNMSFNGDSDIFTEWIISYGHSKGVIFVGSAGNKGLPHIEYPALYKDVFAIGGYVSDKEDYYGNYGQQINFMAPAIHEYNDKCEIGTSISAAQVSGTIAYLQTTYPKMTNEEIYEYLLENSRTIDIDEGYQYPYIDPLKIIAKEERKLYFWSNDLSLFQDSNDVSISIDYCNVEEIEIYDNGSLIKSLIPNSDEIKLNVEDGTHYLQLLVKSKEESIRKDILFVVNHTDDRSLLSNENKDIDCNELK